MAQFNNKALITLLDEFPDWQEGAGAHFYFHPQDRQKLKPILTKPACADMIDKYGYVPSDPKVQEAAGRVVVSGFWHDPNTQRKVWTTGDANPNATQWSRKQNKEIPTVEATHPANMAEKRWMIRGVIALRLGQGSGVYGEEEFGQDYIKEARKSSSPSSTQPAEPQKPGNEDDRNAWWKGFVSGVCEMTGRSWGEVEADLWTHCTIFEHDSTIYVPAESQVPVGKLQSLYDWKPKWSASTYQRMKEVRHDLQRGNAVQLYLPHDSGSGIEEGQILNPTASAEGGAEPTVEAPQ